MAGVSVGGVVLLPLVLSVCASPVGEVAAKNAPAKAKGAIAERPATAASASPEQRLAPAAEAARPGKVLRVEDLPPAKRIEDLPPATPVAYRPLRVEELPEAPRSGRSRRAKEAAPAKPLRIEDLPSVSAAVRPLRPDELNPELVKQADDMLWNHPAPVGVDVPLEVNGKSYVARFAYHYHEFGSAKKPWGYHKGVTLYSTHE